MFPVVFEWGDAVLTSYALLFSLSYFAGLAVALAEGRRLGLHAEAIVSSSLGLLFWGLLGARLLFVLTQWPRFMSGRFGLWDLAAGGVVFYGGFIAALAYLAVNLRASDPATRIAWFATLAPAAAVAHAVGRIGCFLNGCCHGSQCDFPWAVTITDPRSPSALKFVPIHPAPIYEALILAILAVVLLRLNRSRRSLPWTPKLYLIVYGSARFLLEFTRGDTLRGSIGPFSTSQWIALGAVLAGLSLDFGCLDVDNTSDENRNRESTRPL